MSSKRSKGNGMIVAPSRYKSIVNHMLLHNPEDTYDPSKPWILRSGPPVADFKLDDVTDFNDICRICAAKVNPIIPIYDSYGKETHLAEKINQHLPITVSPEDTLPLGVCTHCMHMVVAWNELCKVTLQAEAALRIRMEQVDTMKSEEERKVRKPATVRTFEAPLCDIVRTIVVNYMAGLGFGKISDLQFVCQKCPEHPQCSDLGTLASHMETMHHSYIENQNSIEEFVQNYVTFEEQLMSDDYSEENMESPEPSMSVAKATRALRNYYCPFCPSIFTSPTRLVHHLSRHVDVDIQRGVSCCDRSFNTKSSFVTHLQESHVDRKVDDTGHTCRSCGHSADSAAALADHVAEQHVDSADTAPAKKTKPRATTNNQKYIPTHCPKCNKLFSNKYHMMEHLSTHDIGGDVKAFSCWVCGRQYRWQKCVARHVRVAHGGGGGGGGGAGGGLCARCGERFPSREARDAHLRLAHSALRPFSCPHCGKAFHRKYILDRHIDMHLDVRKYKCSHCPKAFRKGSHLERHRAAHQIVE